MCHALHCVRDRTHEHAPVEGRDTQLSESYNSVFAKRFHLGFAAHLAYRDTSFSLTARITKDGAVGKAGEPIPAAPATIAHAVWEAGEPGSTMLTTTPTDARLVGRLGRSTAAVDTPWLSASELSNMTNDLATLERRKTSSSSTPRRYDGVVGEAAEPVPRAPKTFDNAVG